ncbi:MAG TPA: alpha-2-macroglobulin family protein, partial [Kofleriaceae bacterium]|nr:alpha-2-macroglobulin family protein [Kofleriaceae bacterium]
EKTVVVDKTVQVTGGKPVDFELTAPGGGDYWFVVTGSNDKEEASTAAMQLYAWGDGGGSWRSDDTLAFDIVADKKEYKVGDKAILLLKTDLAQATGLVTIERDGVIEKRLVDVTPTQKHIEVPITDAMAPNMYVSVALVQGRMGEGPRGKPRMRMGIVNLPVRPEDNKLTVSVETDAKDYRPGAPVTATVKVVDKAGNPVAAEVAVTAADEGVLSLIDYETPDPVPTFYAPWGLGVTTATQLEFIKDIPGPNMDRPATGGDAPGTLRSRFVSTAVWAPNAITNASGVATVTFEAPDNLTAFRVMAVAADKATRFGSADQRFTVSKPLQLHQALPRFANLGDQLQGGVVVHNETGKPGTATVKLVSDGKLTVAGGTERTVQVAKDANVPVLFDITAAQLGQSKLAFSVTMNGERDAVELELPVQHPSPAVKHHVAHGATKDAISLPLVLPPDAIPTSAELLVSIDPDGLSGIENGLEELVHYPYGCLEQTTSAVIPMLAARGLAESLDFDGLSGAKLDGFVKAGIAKIGRHQTAYGGFSLWMGGEPDAYYTAYALWGLHLAKRAGYAVDQERINDGLEYLRNDGKRPNTEKPYYNEHGDLGSQAFALYVRALLGDKDPAAVTTLLTNPNVPVYGKAYLARALAAGTSAKDAAVKALVADLARAAAPAKDGKLVVEPHEAHLYGYMSSSLRTTAMVLDTLVALDPKNEAIKPLVAVLMDNRRTARYWDTQENLYTLVALTAYAKTATATAASVTVTLGGKKLIAGSLAGKSRIRAIKVPFAAGELAIAPKGEVRYNVEILHRKDPKTLVPQANGITLSREYLDEAGKPKSSFKVGDVVLVRVTTALGGDYEHFMVSEPLPAGFEPLNARFKTVGSAGIKQSQSSDTFREMHDNRVDFATEYSWKGGATYEFMIRAITAGKFVRPPSVAERMYEPQINARTALDMIEVTAK